MLPDHVLSTQSVPAQFRFPRNIPKRPLIDYEYGGRALNDASRGLRVQVWKGEYIEGQIILSATSVAPFVALAAPDLFDFGFTFDQNMRLAIAYELIGGTSRFRWFDTSAGDYVTLNLPAGSETPRCAHDDNRDMQTPVSDIILAYCRGGSLYFRAQRDRYEVEYLLSSAVGTSGLIQIGMNNRWRFQFQLSTAS